MIDAVISLERAGFTGHYVIVSRHGLVSHSRRAVEAWPDFLGNRPLPRSAYELLRIIQSERKRIAASSAGWQSLPPSLRPHVPALWAGADLRERRRFLRHLRSFWENAFHRVAPPSARFFEEVRASGRVQVRASSNPARCPSASWRMPATP